MNVIQNNHNDYIEKVYTFEIRTGQKPERVDVYLTRSVQNASRTKVIKAIEEGNVTINGRIPKPGRKIKPGDKIECRIMKPPPLELIPEDIPLNIIFEDEYLLVVNKPAGMVTHPGFAHTRGTLVNAVLYHFGYRDNIEFESDEDEEELDEEWKGECSEPGTGSGRNLGRYYASELVRPGIVHRLDKDTSGLLVIAKDDDVHRKLSKQFFERTIAREYRALVWGGFDEREGRIDANIGRSARNRKLFSIVKRGGKSALTHYEVLEEYFIKDKNRNSGQSVILSLLKIKLSTGRTHQIRVHLSGIGHPIFGDVDYGGGLDYLKQFQAYKKIKLSRSRNNVPNQEFGGSVNRIRMNNTKTTLMEIGNMSVVQFVEKCKNQSGRLLLDAVMLGFNHPINNEKMLFRKEIENDMSNVLNLLRNQQ